MGRIRNNLDIPIKVIEEIVKETILQPGEEMTEYPDAILRRIEPA